MIKMLYTIKNYDSGYRFVLRGNVTPYEVSQTDSYAVAKSSAIHNTINDTAMTTIIIDNETGNRQVFSDGEIVQEF